MAQSHSGSNNPKDVSSESQTDTLNCTRIEQVLATSVEKLDWQVELFDELPSTNDHLRARASEISTFDTIQLCATDWQTAGHGRRGKRWSSQRGNVTFTLQQTLTRPAAELLGLSLVAGIAVATVLRECFSLPAVIKWPNDILVHNEKLGGLLLELLPAAPSVGTTSVLTGVGINMVQQPGFSQLGIGATSLERLGLSPQLDRSELIARLAGSIATEYQKFDAAGWAAFASHWPQFDALYGRAVTVTGGCELTGRAVGVNENGALLINTRAGTTPVLAGEVSVRPV